VTLYVGGHGTNIKGDPLALHGERCFSAAHRPFGGVGTRLHGRLDPARVIGLLDSGAFTDPPAQRLTPAAALARQLAWERRASERWEWDWQAQALASYDRLIDEKWHGARRVKERWSVTEAEAAVTETIAAARYLASQRAALAPRRLVLSLQGVDAVQYAECAAEVLRVATPTDWIGLGGWCILGRWQRRWLPTFWQTIARVLPQIAAAGIRHLHLFGCLWFPAVGGLLWLADHYGLTVSADSARPVLDAARTDGRKAGVHGETWRESVTWWRTACASLRETPHYRRPPGLATEDYRQPALPLFAE